MRIIAATSNKGKVREIKKIFQPLGFEVITQREAGITVSPEENGKTFEKNACIKAEAVAALCDDYVLADDSGLCVDALDGRPGVFSARYAGDGASDEEKINKLLGELSDKDSRSAHFETAVVLISPEKKRLIADGRADGHILYEPVGDNGFGYDPIFFSDELGKAFAECSDEEKNSVSHRGRALISLYEKIKETEGF